MSELFLPPHQIEKLLGIEGIRRVSVNFDSPDAAYLTPRIQLTKEQADAIRKMMDGLSVGSNVHNWHPFSPGEES